MWRKFSLLLGTSIALNAAQVDIYALDAKKKVIFLLRTMMLLFFLIFISSLPIKQFTMKKPEMLSFLAMLIS